MSRRLRRLSNLPSGGGRKGRRWSYSSLTAPSTVFLLSPSGWKKPLPVPTRFWPITSWSQSRPVAIRLHRSHRQREKCIRPSVSESSRRLYTFQRIGKRRMRDQQCCFSAGVVSILKTRRQEVSFQQGRSQIGTV